MKKSLVTLLLLVVFATIAVAQQAPADQQAAQGQSSGQKQFKDPAESSAFMAAYNTADPAQKATALESFLQSYPNSIAKQDALELLLAAYQQSQNVPKMQDAAQRLLQQDPKNLKALGILTFLTFSQYQQSNGANMQALAQSAQYAQTGLQSLETSKVPEGVKPEDWDKQKKTFQGIFLQALGVNGLATKDYATAQKYFGQMIAANPEDLGSVWSLAQSELEPKPIVIDGLFWGARAVALAQKNAPQAVPQIQKYVHYKYTRYHGTDQGFNELVQAAATQPTLPQGFTVAPAPSAADMAGDMVKGKQAKDLAFADWEFILTSGNQQAADAIWNPPSGVKGQTVALQGWVATASPKSFAIYGTEDAQTNNKPDIILNLTDAVPAARLPKPGTLIAFQGVPDSYTGTADNFVLTMNDGYVKLPNAPATHTPAKKATKGTKKK